MHYWEDTISDYLDGKLVVPAQLRIAVMGLLVSHARKETALQRIETFIQSRDKDFKSLEILAMIEEMKQKQDSYEKRRNNK